LAALQNLTNMMLRRCEQVSCCLGTNLSATIFQCQLNFTYVLISETVKHMHVKKHHHENSFKRNYTKAVVILCQLLICKGIP